MENFEAITRFPPTSVAFRLGVALAIGMLVGFERESASKDAGIRTFGLTAMLAAVTVMISPAFCMVALAGVIVLVALFNVNSMTSNHSLEITTAAALLVTFALGALVGLGHSFTPVAGAILMTLLLAWKVELRRFAGGVTLAELRSAVLLGLIGFVIYPILPDRFIDRWQLVNLRQAWVTVVVIAGIAFVNYVLLRLYGNRGLLWTAFLGGLVNNRAAIAELMNIVDGTRIVGVVLFATLAMFIRNIFLLALFAPKALYMAIGPLLAMAVVSLLVPTGKRNDEPSQELKLSSPISLRRVLYYGILFLAIQVVGTLAERLFGTGGFMAASCISGIVSSASATAAAANLSANLKITPALAGTATVIASMASLVTNLPLIFKRVTRLVLFKVTFSTALQVALGIAVLAGQRFLFHF
ncbi:MAG TPA: DUF4010 domain-containing protein [Anaeromyxobacteraceae bacterium]|nr:DUF4010 domain-containing protein [Anaeromyxobacteraceae bacterium]